MDCSFNYVRNPCRKIHLILNFDWKLSIMWKLKVIWEESDLNSINLYIGNLPKTWYPEGSWLVWHLPGINTKKYEAIYMIEGAILRPTIHRQTRWLGVLHHGHQVIRKKLKKHAHMAPIEDASHVLLLPEHRGHTAVIKQHQGSPRGHGHGRFCV